MATNEPARLAPWRVLEPEVLTDARLLGERACQLARVRLGLALMIVVGAFVGRRVAGLTSLDVETLTGTALAIVAYDVLAWWIAAARRDRTDDPEVLRVIAWATYGAIVLDYLALTIVVWHVGGARSPFLSFYLLHAIVSGVMLAKWPALALHAFAYVLLSLVVVAEWAGVGPAPRLLEGVPGSGTLGGQQAAAVILSYGLLFLLTAFILTSFSASLRRAEGALRAANAELRRLSDMRRDFLDIALHNLQSPVGAATMHIRNVLQGHGGPVSENQRQWLERSLERLEGLREFMKSLSLLSTLESIRIDEKAAPVEMVTLLGDVVADQGDAAEQRGIELRLEVPQPLPTVRGVELLLREAVANYVTNALKYTPPGGHVLVRGLPAGDSVRVEVRDDGPGIAPEDQKRLFSEFVRLREKGKPVAKVHGSGLGLTIVRRVIDLHGGRTGLESEPGKGSTFYLELPASA